MYFWYGLCDNANNMYFGNFRARARVRVRLNAKVRVTKPFVVCSGCFTIHGFVVLKYRSGERPVPLNRLNDGLHAAHLVSSSSAL